MSIEANKKKRVKLFPHPTVLQEVVHHSVLKWCREHPYCCSKYVRDTSEILESSRAYKKFVYRNKLGRLTSLLWKWLKSARAVALLYWVNTKTQSSQKTWRPQSYSFQVSPSPSFRILLKLKCRKLILLHLSWMHIEINHAQFSLKTNK